MVQIQDGRQGRATSNREVAVPSSASRCLLLAWPALQRGLCSRTSSTGRLCQTQHNEQRIQSRKCAVKQTTSILTEQGRKQLPYCAYVYILHMFIYIWPDAMYLYNPNMCIYIYMCMCMCLHVVYTVAMH